MAQDQGFPGPNIPIVELTRGGVATLPWLQFFLTLWQRTGASVGSNVVSGQVVTYAGTSIPDGWLGCNGAAVSRTGYASLFAAIGTTWGAGDGSSTFNLPDCRGRVLYGATMLAPVGTSGGAATATLGVSNLPAHAHGVVDPGHTHAVTDPGHKHTVAEGLGAGAVPSLTVLASAATEDTSTATTGLTVNSASTGITTSDTGSGTPVDILPPFASMTTIIKI